MTQDHTMDDEFGPESHDAGELEQALAETRERLAGVPAEVVVSNHAMGLYELAAIHLTAEPPRLADAALAIDAVACLVDGLGGRIGQSHETLATALATLKMAYVERAKAARN
jgi:hypothetical protein